MKLWVFLSVLAIAALTFPSCQAAPSTPSPVTSATTNLKVDVKCPEFGESFRCSAFALSGDSGQDVTGLAEWSTGNPAIATVSSGGLVSVLAAGEVSIRASYKGVSGFAIVSVSPGQGLSGTSRNLDGVILSLEGPLADVLMEILTGPNAGRQTTTSSNGRFFMGNLLDSTFSIRLSKPGYVTAVYTWTIPGGQDRTATLTAAR